MNVTHAQATPLMSKPHQPWHKQFWPWFLIVLPGVAVIASLISLGIAIVKRDSLVRDNYYKEGRAINARLDQDRAAAARGIALEGRIDDTRLTLELSGEFATPPQVLTVQFMHPLRDRSDFMVALQRSGGATYTSALPYPLADRWYVEIATPEDSSWRVRGQIDLDSSSQFHVAP